MSVATLAPGFADPVRDAQAVFRSVMMALARPGTLATLGQHAPVPAPLAPGAGAIALSLCDFETPLWLDPTLAAAPAVASWLRFHAGAPIVAEPSKAMFAFVADPGAMTGLDIFAQGTPDYPDRSTTVVIQVPALANEGGWRLRGPGIEHIGHLAVQGLPAAFPDWLALNRATFPCGVDVVFVAGNRVAALPRTTIVSA